MNRHVLARFLRLAVFSCVLLTALQTPALAFSFYDGFVQGSVTPGPLPSGTSFSFLPGFTFSDQFFTGSALATAAASVSPPGSATALATGFASGPSFSQASSFSGATARANIVNHNATTVTFPLTFSHSRNSSATIIPLGGQSDFVGTNAFLHATLDFTFLFVDNSTLCFPVVVSNCNSFDSGSRTFLFGLTPGSHSLEFSVQTSGFAAFSPPFNPTPEPATLLLFGTTIAGLGLARWRRRKLKQESGSH